MPDKNKLEVLAGAGYEIRDICGYCVHSSFRADKSWGVCTLLPYEHGKHTARDEGKGDAPRYASVHAAGWCPKFVRFQNTSDDLVRSGFDRYIRVPDGR